MAPSADNMATEEIRESCRHLGVEITKILGTLMPLLGELGRREGWRDDGATSLCAWVVQHLGVSPSTARFWVAVAERMWDLPHLAGAMAAGDVTLDKVHAALPLATPETDAAVAGMAAGTSVRDLRDTARSARGTDDPEAAAQQATRYLRFNDERRTISVQLPADEYAVARTTLAGAASRLTYDPEAPVPYDQRLCDAFMRILRGGGTTASAASGHFVVVHADYRFLRDGVGEAELERFGPLSRETALRILCDAPAALALDDDVGHTMYEGRAQRLATSTQRREVWRRDRHCRFPSCPNAEFTEVHHLRLWEDGGRTDIDNLMLLCEHHHHRVHENGWRVRGDANGMVSFVSPLGREMQSGPSPQWTKTPVGT